MRAWFAGAALVLTACSQSHQTDVEREIDAVAGALGETAGTPVRDVEQREPGYSRVVWRFQTSKNASPFRQSLVHALQPRFDCATERRRVRCTRDLGGDTLVLNLAAHPSSEGSLILAELVAMPN